MALLVSTIFVVGLTIGMVARTYGELRHHAHPWARRSFIGSVVLFSIAAASLLPALSSAEVIHQDYGRIGAILIRACIAGGAVAYLLERPRTG